MCPWKLRIILWQNLPNALQKSFQRLTRNLFQKLHGYLCQNSIFNIENKSVTVQQNLKKEHSTTGGLRWQLEATTISVELLNTVINKWKAY